MSEQPLRLFDLPEPALSPLRLVEPTPGLWGYFFATQNGYKVKHGVTTDLEERRRDLQTANAEKLILFGAYPTYSKTLEDAIKSHFRRLKTSADNEWFEPWTAEFKITALGGGLPPTIYEQWTNATAERAQLLENRPGSVQANVTKLLARDVDLIEMTSAEQQRTQEWRQAHESDQLIAGVMQELVDKNAFEAMQPLEVQVTQWWERRRSGQVPFDLSKAELRPAYVDLSQMRLHER